MDIFKWSQEDRITAFFQCVARKMFSICPLSPGKATLLSFPNICPRRKSLQPSGFHKRALFWEANRCWLLSSLWGKMKANISGTSCDQQLRFYFVSCPPRLSFSFTEAFIFSLQTQRAVCLHCADIAASFWVGLHPRRVWYTVCWKVLASKDKGLY